MARASARLPALALSLVAAAAVPSAPREQPDDAQRSPLLFPATRFRLEDPVKAAFGFNRYQSASKEKPDEARFFRGTYGPSTWKLVPDFALSLPSSPMSPSAAPLLAEEDSKLRLDLLPFSRPAAKPVCKKPAVTIARYGGEQDTLSLLSCDGEVLPDVLERLSVLLRPPGSDRPELPLPDEPEPAAAEDGEWVAHVKLLPPRLAWVLQRVSDAFPHKTLYVMSGYRPGGHDSAHKRGRAVDLFVMGVANERVYKFCRTMPDVGCGYYPNNKFVHLDVRKPGGGKAYWIDTSGPSEPSSYVDAWPGVEKGGAAAWQAPRP